MKKIVTAVGLIGALISPAKADDRVAAVTLKALSCWDVPAGIAQDLEPIIFDVELDRHGFLEDATVQNFTRDDPKAKTYVISGLRALQRCSPFDGVSGKLRIKLDVAAIPDTNIDPFKQ